MRSTQRTAAGQAILPGKLPTGFDVPSWVCLLLGAGAIILLVGIWGKKIDSEGNII